MSNYKIKHSHAEIIESIYELRKEYEDIINNLEGQLKSHISDKTTAEQNAEKLWKLLDDIDTASDMFKPCESNGIKSYSNFYTYSMNKASERFKVYGSDGYNLTEPNCGKFSCESQSTGESELLPRYIDGKDGIKECDLISESPSPTYSKNIG